MVSIYTYYAIFDKKIKVTAKKKDGSFIKKKTFFINDKKHDR